MWTPDAQLLQYIDNLTGNHLNLHFISYILNKYKDFSKLFPYENARFKHQMYIANEKFYRY